MITPFELKSRQYHRDLDGYSNHIASIIGEPTGPVRVVNLHKKQTNRKKSKAQRRSRRSNRR